MDPDGALHAGECQDPGGVPGSEDPRSSQALGSFKVHGGSQDPQGSKQCARAAEDQDSGGALLHGAVGHGGAHNADGPLDMVPEVDASNGVDIDDGDIEEGGLTESDRKMVEKMNARWREWWHKKLQGDRHKGRLTSPYVVGLGTSRAQARDEQWLGGERPKRPCPTSTGCDPDGPSC